MKPTKQTIYLPVNGSSILSIIEEGRLLDNVEEQEGYFFTPEQLNEYTKTVIKQTSVEFANWIAEEWSPNGRKECWDSKELNSAHESKYLVDTTKELLQIWEEQKPKVVYYQ